MEEIKVYNTLTKEKEVFHPIKEGEAKIYVCGVTPYNHPHIGQCPSGCYLGYHPSLFGIHRL